MREGLTGDPSLLVAKSLLDMFSAAIFASVLGYGVVTLAVPVLLIEGAYCSPRNPSQGH